MRSPFHTYVKMWRMHGILCVMHFVDRIMNNKQLQDLCLQLLHADTEHDVIDTLKRAGFWDNADAWRLYGDKEGNFAQAGNQQALPEAALVEKIVNCCDSRLMAECLKREINPESSEAPRNYPRCGCDVL